MPEKKPRPSKPETHALSVLMKEYDALRDMYNQSVQSGQTMFNYYLTLTTAVFGGITFVSQPDSGVYLVRSTVALLLVFLAILGTFYLSSLTTNHAHTTRYAQGINALRRFIVQTYKVEMPPEYARFLNETPQAPYSKWVLFLALFVPVSTYQLFAAVLNSLAWGFVVGMIYLGTVDMMTTSLLQVALPGVIALVVTFLIYSVYSRLIFQMTLTRATVKVAL